MSGAGSPQVAEDPGWGLRRSALRRPDFADRPIRDLEVLRAEKRRIEDDLLALVAEDPVKVDRMNALLDALSLNGSDHTRRRLARLGERIEALTERLRVTEAEWVWSKAPENALKRAVGRFHHLLSSARAGSPPGGKVADRAVAELYIAVERLVEERLAARSGEVQAGARER